MALFGKGKDKEKEQDAEPAVDPVAEAMADISGIDPSAFPSTAPEQPPAVADGSDAPGPRQDEAGSDAGDPVLGLADVPDAGDGDQDEDLMSLFESEVEEDIDLSALTGELEVIDMQDILVQARDIASKLQAKLEDQ